MLRIFPIRRFVAGSCLALIALAATSGCRVTAPRPPDYSLNGEKNLTNGVWMFGFDKVAARQLADRARADGLIAVRLVDTGAGAQLEILHGCYVQGRYEYKQGATLDDSISIKSKDELAAKLPFSYGSFEGSFSQSSELRIEYRTPGDFVAPTSQFQLTGACQGATHVVTHLTIGAFRTSSAAQAGAQGSGNFLGGPGFGGGNGSSNEQATAGGNFDSCKNDFNLFGLPAAPLECSIPLKLTLAPIGGAAPAAPGAPGGTMEASAGASTCADSSVMAMQGQGFHFDGKVFTIERPQLQALDPQVKSDFACVGAMTPAENVAMDAVIAFLKKRPGVNAHVSVSCTPILLGPMSSNLHMNMLQAKFAAAGLTGRVSFNECLGTLFPVGNGVQVELVAGCSDHPAPPKPKGGG